MIITLTELWFDDDNEDDDMTMNRERKSNVIMNQRRELIRLFKLIVIVTGCLESDCLFLWVIVHEGHSDPQGAAVWDQGVIQSLPLFCIAVKTFVKDFYFFNTDVDILHKVESIIIILLFSVFSTENLLFRWENCQLSRLESREFIIEAGTLLSADNGVCSSVLTSLTRWTPGIRLPSMRPWRSKPSPTITKAG